MSSRAVFVSYTSEDLEAARHLCETLRAGGIEVWFDQNELRGGDAWDQKIRGQIRDCALFIPIISAHTQSRQEGYFRLEWRLADQRTHLMARNKAFVIPVVIDGTSGSSADVPESFSAVQWTRLPAGATPPAFVARVRQLLSPESEAAPAAREFAYAARAGRTWGTAAVLGILVAVLAVIGAGYWAMYRFVLPRSPAVTAVAASPAVVGADEASGSPPEKSIAVLPFLDISEKRDQEYFSDGLSEELIDLLAKTPGLEVIARTSSFYFKGRQATIGEIAKTLNVANVIEGSVRKSGNTLRVTAQLIRARDGVNLWSETYDRDLKDVFQVQDDIARGVVDKLKLTLLAAPSDPAMRTANTAAYSLYLQGRYFVGRDSEADLAKAQDFFQQALALDPNYAPAWAAEGSIAVRRIANGFITEQEGLAAARAAAAKALQLDPTNGDACAVRGNDQFINLKWREADATFSHCRQIAPDNSNVLLGVAILARQLGRDEESLAIFHQVLERDPLNFLAGRYLARTLYHAGRLGDAEAAIRHVIDINSMQPGVHYELGRILLATGDMNGALAAFAAENGQGWKQYGLALGCRIAEHRAQAEAALKDMRLHEVGSEFQLAETYAYCGDADRAFEWLDKCINNDPGILWLIKDPLFQSLLNDPRYAAYLRKINLS